MVTALLTQLMMHQHESTVHEFNENIYGMSKISQQWLLPDPPLVLIDVEYS